MVRTRSHSWGRRTPAAVEHGGADDEVLTEIVVNPEELFHPYQLGAAERERLDRDGHLALPGLLTAAACERLTGALSGLPTAPPEGAQRAQHYSAEHDAFLASLIGHPQLVGLARQVLGPEVRFDHCVSLNRPAGDG